MEELSMVIYRLLSLKGPAHHILSVNFFIIHNKFLKSNLFFIYIYSNYFLLFPCKYAHLGSYKGHSLDTKSIISNHISGKRTSLFSLGNLGAVNKD